MTKEIGPRERQLREMREARAKASRGPNPFEDTARGRDPVSDLKAKVSAIKPKKKAAKRGKGRGSDG